MKGIKFSEVIQIVKPEYVYLKLKPNNSIRNQQTHLIARTIATFYRSTLQQIRKQEEKAVKVLGRQFFVTTKWQIQRPGKVAYYVYLENKKAEFYFILPRQYLTILKERIGDVWTGVTVEEVKTIPTFTEKAEARQMVYEKEDGLSLDVNRSSNALLHSNLNVIDVMEEGDRVGILYNFIPGSQGSFKHSHRATMEKMKHSRPTERNKKGGAYLFKMALAGIDGIIQTLTEVVAGKAAKNEESALEAILERLNGGNKASENSLKKVNASILDTQILILSESPDHLRQRNNVSALAQSFDTISEDNKLTPKRFNGTINFNAYRIQGAEVNRISDGEAQNFIALAGREVLERYKFIDKVETQEIAVPEELTRGVMCIGENTFRGKKTPVYLSNDKEFRNLLTLLIGPTRAGKSNLIGNISIDAIEAGEMVILFDFIKNCELSRDIAALFPPDRVLNIECKKFEDMQGMGYNEVGRTGDPFQDYVNAKEQAANLSQLVNAINADEARLSPKMERYLESAALVVFISGGSIRDVFNVLQVYRARHEFINKVPEDQRDNLAEYIENLHELDETDTKGNITEDTKINLIVGIIDRLNALKRNPYMELMLKKGTENNINLVEEMQKSQLVCIKMPEKMFTTDSEKDAYTTYWLTKILLALSIRADKYEGRENELVKVNLVIDEIYQTKNTERALTAKLSRIAKFMMKPIISCHYINQLEHMRQELRSANTSYILIAGCDKDNYRELKSELQPFDEEDLTRLPRYHAMCYVKCNDGYTRFISKLPGEVEKRIKAKRKQQEEAIETLREGAAEAAAGEE